jgi:hypothetical protein
MDGIDREVDGLVALEEADERPAPEVVSEDEARRQEEAGHVGRADDRH